MKLVRRSLISAFALVLGLAVVAPVPAHAQGNGNLQVATSYGILVPATDQQLVRVTVGNPYLAESSSGEGEDSGRTLLQLKVVIGGVEETHTIAAGTAFKYVIDPVPAGTSIDAKSRVNNLKISFVILAQVVEGQRAPQPSITIEVVHERTGAVHSFVAFPGFTGGVTVAAADVN